MLVLFAIGALLVSSAWSALLHRFHRPGKRASGWRHGDARDYALLRLVYDRLGHGATMCLRMKATGFSTS